MFPHSYSNAAWFRTAPSDLETNKTKLLNLIKSFTLLSGLQSVHVAYLGSQCSNYVFTRAENWFNFQYATYMKFNINM